MTTASHPRPLKWALVATWGSPLFVRIQLAAVIVTCAVVACYLLW